MKASLEHSRNQIIMNLTGGLIAVLLCITLFMITWALIYQEVPSGNAQGLMIVIGILTTNIGSVVNFFFGSSSGSRTQNETIATQAKVLAAGASSPGPKTVVAGPGDVTVNQSGPPPVDVTKDP